jgi:SAM-dependent methyltransferase
MLAENRYSAYDPFAKLYNEYWALPLQEYILPALNKLLLPCLRNDAHILDLCCGTGQLCQQLLTMGYVVTGLDASEEMLKYARQNANNANFILTDARLFSLPATFNAVISTSDSLNHILEIEELVAVFQNVYQALLPDGIFVFDLNDERYYQTEGQMAWGNCLGNIKDDYVWTALHSYDKYNKIGQRQVALFDLINNTWRRLDATLLTRAYSHSEVLKSLKDAGFIETQLYETEQDLNLLGESGQRASS